MIFQSKKVEGTHPRICNFSRTLSCRRFWRDTQGGLGSLLWGFVDHAPQFTTSMYRGFAASIQSDFVWHSWRTSSFCARVSDNRDADRCCNNGAGSMASVRRLCEFHSHNCSSPLQLALLSPKSVQFWQCCLNIVAVVSFQ